MSFGGTLSAVHSPLDGRSVGAEVPARAAPDKQSGKKMNPTDPLIRVLSGSQCAHTLLVISQLAILTRQGPDSMTVFAVDQETGRPEKDVEIEIYENRQKVRTGKTDSSGLARYEIESSSAMVMARKGEHFSVYDPRYLPSALNDKRVYLFTERPAYRPGHEVFFKGMMR